MDGLLDSMPAEVFAEWQAFDQLEPFGSRAITAAIGRLAAVTAETEKPEVILQYVADGTLPRQKSEAEKKLEQILIADFSADS